MPAYVILLRESPVHDPEAMAEYRRVGEQNRGDSKMVPRAVYGALEALEGETPDGAVILEFPTVEEARAWYYSPGYQAAAPHRLASAEYRSFIVEGL